RAVVHTCRWRVPTPANTSGAAAPTTFNTTITHSAITTPAERSRPHRSMSPPTVSSNAVPPSAQYALTAALAVPRLAAIGAATRAPRSDRTSTPQSLHASRRLYRTVTVGKFGPDHRMERCTGAVRTTAWTRGLSLST